ncbi:TonB family protein [Methylobacterium sp. JK268]
MIHPPPDAFVAAIPARRPPVRDERSPALRALTWALATALTAGLHVGLYRALTRDEPAAAPRPAEAPAAIMVNLAPIPVTARSEVDNQADGPASAANEAAAETPEPPPPPAEEAVVAAPPPPPEVKPQAVLPAPAPKPKPRAETPPEKPAEKPKPRKESETPRKPKPREQAKTASRAGGGSRSDRQTAARTAAPVAGEAVSEASRASWQNEVRSRIVRAKRFPSEAHGATGVAVVSVTFTASGGAGGARLVASSGNAALDAEAVAVMSRAAPYPPPPSGRATVLTVPLNFRR